MAEIVPFLEVPDALIEAGGNDLYLCFQCGTCSGLCPWNDVASFNVREVIRAAQLGTDIEDTLAPWRCVTCGACVVNCPREVPIIDIIRSVRSVAGDAGGQPPQVRAMLAAARQDGNPWAGEPAERNDWAEPLGVPVFDGTQEWLFYACCTTAYDPGAVAPGRALLRLLAAAGVSFGIAPPEAVCCASSVRESGDTALAESLGRRNARLFSDAGARRVLVASPHCMNAFRKEPPGFGELETIHSAILLRSLLREGRLPARRSVDRVVTYHDPCYLGRHNGIFDEPREVLTALPGCELREMPRNRESSLCCGGGGGRMFVETPASERFANLRVQEAIDTGADTLVTACPYCHAMFRDAVKSLDVEDRLAVLDLAEVVAESVQV